MKIAFYVPNKGLKKVDFSTPFDGNPGSGAAEYLHVALPYYIRDNEFETYILAEEITHMPANLKLIKCNGLRDAAILAKKNGIDVFVFRPRIHEESNILDLIDELQLLSIGRAALTPSVKHQRKMARSNYFRALVAVGSEQFDFMCDSPVAEKLTYIDNGLLGRGDKKLKDNICKLLNNPELAISMGKNGRVLAEEIYDFNKVAIRWKMLFTDVYNHSKIRSPRHQFNYLYYHRKWLRAINYIPAKIFNHLMNWPSIQEFEDSIINLAKKLKNLA